MKQIKDNINQKINLNQHKQIPETIKIFQNQIQYNIPSKPLQKMYSDFYLPSVFSTFSQFIPFHSFFPVFQSSQKSQITHSNLVNCQHQSYTTKQTPLKQEVIIVKKEKELIQKTQEASQKVQKCSKKQNKSIFHNYQKHLITTLKQKITINQLCLNQQQNQCMKQLWISFNKSKVANRTLLLAIFGDKDTKNEDLSDSLRKCGLECLLEKYSIEEIKWGQFQIRKVVIEYFKQRSLEEELAGRKLPQEEKVVFKHYVNYFLSQLEEGTLNKRLPKRYKKQMML